MNKFLPYADQSVERAAVARNLRELAADCADRIDGAEESRGYDVWLTTLIDGMRHAAALLDPPKPKPTITDNDRQRGEEYAQEVRENRRQSEEGI